MLPFILMSSGTLQQNMEIHGNHRIKYQYFTEFSGVKVLLKHTLSAELYAYHFAFPQNFHTRKLIEITVFYPVNFRIDGVPLQIKPVKLLYKC